MTEHKDSMTARRLAAVALLRRGVVTLADIAWLTGASRQLVRHWAKQAGVDSLERRATYLERQWARQMRRETSRKRQP